MTSESLEAAVKELTNLVEETEDEEWDSSFYDDVKSLALDLQMLLKAREDHDRAERAELAKQLWAALRPQDGIPFYTISREKFDSIVSKLEADSQPKQEREA